MVENFMDLFVCENMALCCFSLKSYNFILLFCIHSRCRTLVLSVRRLLLCPHPSSAPRHWRTGSCVCFLVYVNFIRRSLSLICRLLHAHPGMLARFMCTALPNDKRWCVSRSAKKNLFADSFLYTFFIHLNIFASPALVNLQLRW